MNKEFTERIMVLLIFQAKSRISSLSHYHGANWNGLLRGFIKSYISENKTMHDLGITIHPVDIGITNYNINDSVHLGLSFPITYLKEFLTLFRNFNKLPSKIGQFNTESLLLKEVQCRISGNSIYYNHETYSIESDIQKINPLTLSIIEQEANELISKEKFSLQFYAPLCLKASPIYKKDTNHLIAGYDFFTDKKYDSINHLLLKLGIENPKTNLFAVDGEFIWYDNKYGKKFKNHKDTTTTMGGIFGNLYLSGKLTLEEAKYLVMGQYIGIGKSRTFGFGFYHIPEIITKRKVIPLYKSQQILNQSSDPKLLEKALQNIQNSSPGTDGLTKIDLQKAGLPFMEIIADSLKQRRFKHSSIKDCKIKRKGGGYRVIHVFNVTDKIVHRKIADMLKPLSEKILSDSSFAYRSGRNRKHASLAIVAAMKEGFSFAIKSDIQAFFDSVDRKVLIGILKALLPFDDLYEFINNWLKHCENNGVTGLPQGSPLSPVLSNIYMDRFDRQMTKAGFRVFRHGDDFVLLHKKLNAMEIHSSLLIKTLESLKLKLHCDKTEKLDQESTFTFLGYEISNTKIITSDKTKTNSVDI